MATKAPTSFDLSFDFIDDFFSGYDTQFLDTTWKESYASYESYGGVLK